MSDDRDELRFAKTQQWYVAAAAVSLYAGTYAVLRAAHLRRFEVGLVIVFVATVAIAGTVILWQLQSHMRDLRRNTPEINVPLVRARDVIAYLTGIIWVVGISVFYLLFVHRISGRHLSP
jgi:uncharacterized membrane protein YidH (DUF202 family)